MHKLSMWASLGFVMASLAAQADPVPIIEYTFNETGTNAFSSGSQSTPMILKNSSGIATDLHGLPGSGVKGTSSDRAFNNTATSGAVGGWGEHAVDLDAIDELASFTFTCWFKSDTGLNPGGRLIHKRTGPTPTDGFDIFLADGQCHVKINDGQIPSVIVYTNVAEWVFLAITYDSTASEKNIKFYNGSPTKPVYCNREPLFSKGVPVATATPAAFGNINSEYYYQRPFVGYLDNIRMYGSKTDSSGVLSLAQLEALRQADLKVIKGTVVAIR